MQTKKSLQTKNKDRNRNTKVIQTVENYQVQKPTAHKVEVEAEAPKTSWRHVVVRWQCDWQRLKVEWCPRISVEWRVFEWGFLKFTNLILKKSNLKTSKSWWIQGGGQRYEAEIGLVAGENVLVVLLDKYRTTEEAGRTSEEMDKTSEKAARRGGKRGMRK